MLMSRRGFTLVELVIVILILGIVGAVAVPKVINSTEDTAVQAALRDFDAIFDAAEYYKAQHGKYPSDTSSFNAPGDFKGYLPSRVFQKAPPLGGDSYLWIRSSSGAGGTGEGIVAIEAGSKAISEDMALAIDSLYDDGNLSTGAVQLLNGGKMFAIAIDYAPPTEEEEVAGGKTERVADPKNNDGTSTPVR